MFIDILKGDLRASKRRSKSFSGEFKKFLRKFQGCFKKLSSVLQENFKTKVSRVFHECFNDVLFCDFVVAWISS